MNECTYWEYPGGGERPRPCTQPAARGSVYCTAHRAVVLEGMGRIARLSQLPLPAPEATS